jgi:hypothetical protein
MVSGTLISNLPVPKLKEDFARPGVPFFGQGRVANTREAVSELPPDLPAGSVEFPRALGIVDDIVEVGQALFARELAQCIDIAIGQAVGGKDVVIGNDHDLARIPDLGVPPKFPMENADGARSADIVGQEHVGIDPDIIAGFDASVVTGAGENFFRECHRDRATDYDTRQGGAAIGKFSRHPRCRVNVGDLPQARWPGTCYGVAVK